MNFIDISNWQNGIDLAVLFRENTLDGVVIKATGGTSYKNPEFDGWARWLYENRKFMGAYHYCRELTGNPGSPEAEARHFYNVVKLYIGNIVLAADFEADNSDAFQKGTAWLKEFLDALSDLSGVRPLVYCSQSVTQMFNFNEIVRSGYQLWMAQYADYQPVYGFLENPWHNGSVAPFAGYHMQQYTSCGVLNGWRSYLDLDKFYGTESDWKALCEADKGETKPISALKPADPTVVSQVLMNRYGTGEERRQALIKDGYDPDKVQAKINELYAIAAKVKPIVQSNKAYINSITKLMKL